MNTKLYLTVAAVVAILYALAFLLIPVQASLFFSDFAEPRAVLYLRFCVQRLWRGSRIISSFSEAGCHFWVSSSICNRWPTVRV